VSNQSLRAESWDKQSQTFRRKLKNGGASTMYLFCFCYFLLNTSQNVQMDRIDGSLCISAKKIQDSAPLNSLLGNFWDKSFFTGTNRNPAVFSSIALVLLSHFHFPFIYSFYLNRNYTQEGWRIVHQL